MQKCIVLHLFITSPCSPLIVHYFIFNFLIEFIHKKCLYSAQPPPQQTCKWNFLLKNNQQCLLHYLYIGTKFLVYIIKIFLGGLWQIWCPQNVVSVLLIFLFWDIIMPTPTCVSTAGSTKKYGELFYFNFLVYKKCVQKQMFQ